MLVHVRSPSLGSRPVTMHNQATVVQVLINGPLLQPRAAAVHLSDQRALPDRIHI